MKKNYLIVMLALVCNFAMAQIQQTSYKGAFAPGRPMWTAGWTNFDPNNADYEFGARTGAVVTISADVTSNATWTKNNVYVLNGLINVRNNATLTIQPGTLIRSSLIASALVITRGAKLIANGTVTEPIVFTSNKAAGSRLRGDWGGIVILGKARYNINNGVNFIEGLTQTVLSEFGGGTTPDDNDNSGILRYVRIEFAGFVFSPNNELNGLTMGAVGKGTTIENVQVSYSNDDSFEWFGGSVNCKNLVAFAGLDDDFDVDSGYKGIVQFGLSVKDPLAADISTSEIFEVDNNAGGLDTTTAQLVYGDFTSAIFTNITAIGPNKRPNGPGTFVAAAALHDKALRLRRASRVNIYNSIFLDAKRGLSIESVSSNTAYNTNVARFKNNTIVTPTLALGLVTDAAGTNGANAATQTWFALPANAITVLDSNAGILANPYNGDNATDYRMAGEGAGTIDYRPASVDATTGASFTDSKLAGFITLGTAPVVAPDPLVYCKGVVALPLTANLTGDGVSLRWYTTPTATIATTAFTTTAPTPATSTVGSKTYYVREIDVNGALSAASSIAVTVVAAPAVALGTITSVDNVTSLPAKADVSLFIGNTNTITYTVPASTENILGVPVVTSYFWTVPLGANIIGDATGTSIVVNFANVPSGVFKVGSITAQAVNAGGCRGAIKAFAVTAALPKAPAAIVMTNTALPLVPKTDRITGVVTQVPRALTSFAEWMGTTTPLVVTATPAAGAIRYVWDLPTGVNTSSVVTNTEIRFYNLFPFIGAGATTAPSTAGNVFYEITTVTYDDGTRRQTGRIRQNPRAASGSTPVILIKNDPLTNTTNEGVVFSPAYPILFTTTNVLPVNFAGVTAANTTVNTANLTKLEHVMRIGVRTISNVGASVTKNATALIPDYTLSLSKLLTLKAVLPAAPAAVIGQVTALCPGVSYTYTITKPSLLASSYAITAPAGSVVTSASNPTNTLNTLSTSDLVFSVVYPAGFVANTTTLATLDVRGVNGIGASLLAKVTKLSTLIPTVGTVTSTTAGITQFNQTLTAKVYTVPAIVGATGYVWTVANGAAIVSGQGTNSITVDFSAVPVATTKTIITVRATTACGTSATKAITLSFNSAAARLRQPEAIALDVTEVYPNPVSSEFSINVTASTAGTLDISIYSLDGTLIVSPKSVQLQEGTNTITENISDLNNGIYILQLVNSSNGEVITKKLIKE